MQAIRKNTASTQARVDLELTDHQPLAARAGHGSWDKTDPPGLSIDPPRRASSGTQAPLPLVAIDVRHGQSAASMEKAGKDALESITDFLRFDDTAALAQTSKSTRDTVMITRRFSVVAGRGCDLRQAQHDRDRRLELLERASVCTRRAAGVSFVATMGAVAGYASTVDAAAAYAAIGSAAVCAIFVLGYSKLLGIIPDQERSSATNVATAEEALQMAVASFNEGPVRPGPTQDAYAGEGAEDQPGGEVRISIDRSR